MSYPGSHFHPLNGDRAGHYAVRLTANYRVTFGEAWRGELVLTLVSDEETGGRWGTQYLLANVEEAVGDAVPAGECGGGGGGRSTCR